MSKKARVICGIIYIFIAIGIIVLFTKINNKLIEKNSIGYIIANLDEFKDTIHDTGYDVRVAYTLGDIWPERDYDDSTKSKRIGHEKNGILVLYNKNAEYWFDVGFNVAEVKLNDAISVRLVDLYEDDYLGIYKLLDRYAISVCLHGKNFENDPILSYSNKYTYDFTKSYSILGDDKIRDKEIKKYISSDELCEIYEKGISLQDKLVDMYKHRKK